MSGEFSQAFFLDVNDLNLILRLNSHTNLGFQKEQIVNLEDQNIPTPKIHEIGNFDEKTYYCMSEMIEGKALRDVSDQENIATFPDLFLHMNKIHLSTIDGQGYGKWDANKLGKYSSWEEQMIEYMELDSWVTLSEKCKFLQIDVLESLKNEFYTLNKFLKNYSYFLHGDFGRSNILVKNRKITGIIDWSEAMFGDFLWDLAWLSFWPRKIGLMDEYYEFNKNNKDLNFTYFSERMKIYKIIIVIHTLLFAAKKNDLETYEAAILRIK